MVRLQDVARAAGVSTATASRALSRPDLVAADTRERILELARGMGLRLNPSARALTTGRTRTVGVLVPSLANPYFAPVIGGVQRYLAAAGGHVLVAATEDSGREEVDLVVELAGHVDGLVLIAPRRPEPLAEFGTARMVSVDRRIDGLAGVVADTPQGVGDLVDHLVGLGHRRLTLVSGPSGSWLDRERQEFAHRRARAAGAEVSVIGPVPPTLDAGIGIGRGWDPAAGVSAVIGYSSYVCLGLVLALRERGLAVPGDVSVAAADDLTVVSGPEPLLTSLAVPLAAVGERAAELIVQAEEPAPEVIRLPTVVIPGRTTGPVRSDRPRSAHSPRLT